MNLWKVFLFISLLFGGKIYPVIVWPPPIDIAPGSDFSVRVALDSNENAVAVWSTFDGSNYLITASTKPAGGDWTAPEFLSDPGQNAFRKEVGVDASGNILVGWLRFNGANFVFQSSTKLFGESWGAVQTVDPGIGISNMSLAVDPQGNAAAVFQLDNAQIRAITKTLEGAWSALELLSTGPVFSNTDPDIAIDTNGNVIAVWAQLSSLSLPNHSSVAIATKPFGEAWEPFIEIAATVDGQYANFPRIGFDDNDIPIAVWFQDDLSGQFVNSATFLSGSWMQEAIPDSHFDYGTFPTPPVLAVRGNGIVGYVWPDLDSMTGNVIVQAATKIEGGSWTTPTTLSSPDSVAYEPHVALSLQGLFAAIWISDLMQVLSSDKLLNGEWSIPVNISGLLVYQFSSDIAFGSSNNPLAAWYANTPAANGDVIQSTEGEGPSPPSPIDPPTSILGFQTQNVFGAVSELFNTIQWGASPSVDVANYRIVRNGVFIASVLAFRTSYEDHDRTKGQTYTYQVSAVNSSEEESTPVTVAVPPLQHLID